MPSKNENKVKTIAFDMIKSHLKFELLNLLSNISERISKSGSYVISDDLSHIHNKLCELTCELSTILYDDIEKRTDFFENLKELKQKLITYAKPINIYFDFLATVSVYFGNQLKSTESKKSYDFLKNPLLDLKSILNDCLNFILNNKNQLQKSLEMSELLSVFPLRMTTAKYNDYISNSMELMFTDTTMDFIQGSTELLKEKFAPFKSKLYGTSEKEIAEELIKLWNTDYAELSEEDNEKIHMSFHSIIDTLTEKMDFSTEIYDNIGYLMNIASFCIDEDFLFENDIMFKDAYYALCNLIRSPEDRELFSNDLTENINNQIELIFEKNISLEKNYSDIRPHIDETQLSADALTYIRTADTILHNFNTPIFNEFMSLDLNDTDTATQVSENIIKDKIKELIDHIASLKDCIDIKRYKFLKATFLKNLFCPLKVEEYKEYLNFVLSSILNTSEEHVYISNLIEFLEDKGYIENNDNDFQFHNDCTCGCHEHHHHH